MWFDEMFSSFVTILGMRGLFCDCNLFAVTTGSFPSAFVGDCWWYLLSGPQPDFVGDDSVLMQGNFPAPVSNFLLDLHLLIGLLLVSSWGFVGQWPWLERCQFRV